MTEGRQILLADDDEQVQRAVTRVAQKHSYNVIHVTAGGDVLTRAIETKPELIVLDVSFPDADGRDILTALNAQGPARVAETRFRAQGAAASHGLQGGS